MRNTSRQAYLIAAPQTVHSDPGSFAVVVSSRCVGGSRLWRAARLSIALRAALRAIGCCARIARSQPAGRLHFGRRSKRTMSRPSAVFFGSPFQACPDHLEGRRNASSPATVSRGRSHTLPDTTRRQHLPAAIDLALRSLARTQFAHEIVRTLWWWSASGTSSPSPDRRSRTPSMSPRSCMSGKAARVAAPSPSNRPARAAYPNRRSRT